MFVEYQLILSIVIQLNEYFITVILFIRDFVYNKGIGIQGL